MGGMHQHQGVGNAVPWPGSSVCGGEGGGHGVEMEPVAWETGYRSLGFSLGPSDVGKYEFLMLSRTFYVELKEEN